MKRSRHYQGSVASRAALRRLAQSEAAKGRTLGKRDQRKLAQVKRNARVTPAPFIAPIQGLGNDSKATAIASTKIAKAGFNPTTGIKREQEREIFPPGLEAHGPQPSKDHLPYVVSAIVSREARVHVTSRFDHYGVLYPVETVWAKNPSDALRQAGANSRQYRAQLAPSAYKILADRRGKSLNSLANLRRGSN